MEGTEPIFPTGTVEAARDSGRARPGAAVPVRVAHFMRGPMEDIFSVERIFGDVREALPIHMQVEVVRNARPNKGFVPRLMNALTARRHRSEVNHVLGDTQYLAWFLPRARTILTVLDCVSLDRLSGWRRRVFWFFWYWWPLKRAAQVTVLSDFMRRSLLSWVRYPEERISIIPPPLSAEFIRTPSRPFAHWSRLLHIGVTQNKNMERTIEAVTGLNVTMVFIGQLREDLKEMLLERGIRYENYHGLDRDGLVEQYRNADMLVFPSTYEGWGMPIIEAQAVGRPVVTSNVTAMPEAAGDGACLVDPFDVASIRAGICRILNDEAYARALIDAGFENAAKYTVERIAADYAALYQSVADENRPPGEGGPRPPRPERRAG